MAKISTLALAGPLDGSEDVPLVQNGQARRINPADHLAYLATGAEMARDQAADLVDPANIFVDVALGVAEAAVADGVTFKLVNSGTGIVQVRKRQPVGSDLLYEETTTAALAAAAGAAKVGTKMAGAGTRTRTIAEQLAERRSMLGMVGGVPDGETPQDTAFANLVQAGSRSIIPYYGFDYVLEEPLQLPAGAKLFYEGSPRILYVGTDLGDHYNPTGVLLMDDDTEVASLDGRGTLFIESAAPARYLYAAKAVGKRGWKLDGVMGLECNHFMTTASGLLRTAIDAADPDYDPYDHVETSGVDENVCRGFEVSRGGARFTDPSPHGNHHGAAYIAFAFDFDLWGARYRNVAHGPQAWGGDANFAVNGAIGNERKCGDGRIWDIRGEHFYCFVWGSMWRDMTIWGCYGKDALDLMYDSEGGEHINFQNCPWRRAHNGGLGSFSYNIDLVFDNCPGVQDDPDAPFFRSYNASQAMDNRDVTVRNSKFECTGGIGTVDMLNGPVRNLKLENLELVNVRIDLVANNNHSVEIINVSQLFTVAAAEPFVARRFGGCNSYAGKPGIAQVKGGSIRSEVDQPAGTVAMTPVGSDFNFAATAIIENVTVAGFAHPLKPQPLGENSGNGFEVIVKSCMFQQGDVVATSSAFTADAGSDVVTHSIVGLQDGDLVRLSTTNALPAPLAPATNYFWIRITETTGKLSATKVAGVVGPPIDITDVGAGVHTMTQGSSPASVTTAGNLDFAGNPLA